MLNRIGAVGTRQDLVALLVSLELDDALAPTRIVNTTDTNDAGHVITGIAAGGLSLPDRDYYFRDDAATKKIRDEFGQHVTKMMQLVGESPDAAAATARTVFDFESTLAQSTLTLVARRDPYQTHHNMDFTRLKELAPVYDWNAAFKLLNISTTVTIDVHSRNSSKHLTGNWNPRQSKRGRHGSAGAWLTIGRNIFRRLSMTNGFISTARYCPALRSHNRAGKSV